MRKFDDPHERSGFVVDMDDAYYERPRDRERSGKKGDEPEPEDPAAPPLVRGGYLVIKEGRLRIVDELDDETS